jgi:radical SAM superfamily enzyme YgiQ (UPF0313 family)
MKLVLINPASSGRAGLSDNYRSKHPPLALAMLAEMTPDDWEIVVQDENYGRAEIVPDANLVGITSFTSRVNRAYELSTQYRQLGIPTVLGGIHAWARSDEAMARFTSVVIGEAESVWSQLCQDARQDKLQAQYIGRPASRFTIPDRSVLRPEYPVDSIATSRGCPENCSFCSVHDFSGKKFRRQLLSRVEEDLQNIKSDYVFVVDDNFRGFNYQHLLDSIAILKLMAQAKKEYIIQCPMRVCQEDDFLQAAGEAGVRMIFVGLETGDEQGLQIVSKRQNLKYGFDFSRIHKAGIGVIGSFMIGLDTDTPQKLRDRAKFMVDCGIDSIQVTIVTPLPGTRLFNQLLSEGRLLYTNFPEDWGHYDMSELVYLPSGFRSLSEFYAAACDVVQEVFSDAAIKMMVRRTYDVTKSQSVALFAQMLNYSYREIIWEEAKMWNKLSWDNYAKTK